MISCTMHVARFIGTFAIAIAIVFSGTQVALSQASISGTVYESGGRPAVSKWVILRRDGDERRFLTGDDGSYFLGNVSPGQYTLVVRDQDRQLYSAQVYLPTNGPHNISLP